MIGGPWLLFYHYLIVRQWDLNFDSNQANIEKVTVWIRILSLPMKYFDEKFLIFLGNQISKTLKVDATTME